MNHAITVEICMNKHKLLRDFFVIICFFVLVVMLILGNADKQDCICSVLSRQSARYPITSHLYSVYDLESVNSGTFVMLQTTCMHGKRVILTIYPDEGYFEGYLQ